MSSLCNVGHLVPFRRLCLVICTNVVIRDWPELPTCLTVDLENSGGDRLQCLFLGNSFYKSYWGFIIHEVKPSLLVEAPDSGLMSNTNFILITSFNRPMQASPQTLHHVNSYGNLHLFHILHLHEFDHANVLCLCFLQRHAIFDEMDHLFQLEIWVDSVLSM
jgi:hypothetical protein